MADIRRIGVVGCGLMGARIAEISARAAVDTVVVKSPERVALGQANVTTSLERAAAKGRIPSVEVAQHLAIVRPDCET